jgi:hypothetical protein
MQRVDLIAFAALALFGFAAGAAATVWAISWPRAFAAGVDAGGWQGNPLVGSRAADPWTRAAIARQGLLALAKTETIYFSRAADEAGRPLSAACIYEMAGAPPAAGWWSVTLYAEDHYLAGNSDDAHSIDATRALPTRDGGFRTRIAPTRADAANWISSRNAGAFTLTARLYNPDPAIAADFSKVRLPQVRRLSCAGAPS